MYTAMLTVANIADGASHDIWSVNVEQQYHEAADPASSNAGTGHLGTGRSAPILPASTPAGTAR